VLKIERITLNFMETKDILTMVGWPVSCVLSILAGGLIIPKLTRKRKILSWATVSETALIPVSLRETLSVPITIEIGGVSPKSLTLVNIRIGNSGNEVIENVSVALMFNQKAKVLYIKPAGDLGEFGQHVKGDIQSAKTVLTFAHINPRMTIDFELLLSDYDEGSMVLDASGAGLEVRRREANKWDISTSVLKSVGLSLAGIRYDPAAASMFEIAAELKALRRTFQR